MANPSKSKGTAFETNVVRYLQESLGQPEIERRALHGSHDLGDVHRIAAHGLSGIAECKDYREYCDADLARWRSQTLAERENAGAGFALLVVHRRGRSSKWDRPSFGENVVWLTVADLMRIGALGSAGPWDDAEYVWVSMRLCDACDLMRYGGE